MKKVIVLSLFVFLGTVVSNAQSLKFGIKAGANFANFSGDDIDSDNITSYHFGAIAELNFFKTFSIQPELLYSSQGAEVEGFDDINLDYLSVPVLAKFYIIPGKFSFDIGPQFSFLVNDNFEDFDDTIEKKDFDLAATGGFGVNIAFGVFAQARYTLGINDAAENVDLKNNVFQLSVGYKF